MNTALLIVCCSKSHDFITQDGLDATVVNVCTIKGKPKFAVFNIPKRLILTRKTLS